MESLVTTVLSPVNADIVPIAAPNGFLATAPKRVPSARRCLFGPPDHRKVDLWLKEQLTEIRMEGQRRWGLKFAPNMPSYSATTDCHQAMMPMASNFVVTAVPADQMPKFYHTSKRSSEMTCLSSDVENHMPCTSNKPEPFGLRYRFSANAATPVAGSSAAVRLAAVVAEAATVAAARPSTSVPNAARRSADRRQTKLTAFMKVESRKRLRVQQQQHSKLSSHRAFPYYRPVSSDKSDLVAAATSSNLLRSNNIRQQVTFNSSSSSSSNDNSLL